MKKQLTLIPQKYFQQMVLSFDADFLLWYQGLASLFFNGRDSLSCSRKLILDQQNNEMYYPFHLITLACLSISMFKNAGFLLTQEINWLLMQCPTINTETGTGNMLHLIFEISSTMDGILLQLPQSRLQCLKISLEKVLISYIQMSLGNILFALALLSKTL